MNQTLRLVTALAAPMVYLAALRFVLPPDQPYFILGIGIVALIARLMGAIPAILALAALIPLTNLVYQQFTVSASYLHFASSPAYLGLQIALALGIGHMRREKIRLQKIDAELLETNARMQDVLSKVQELGGVYNLCSDCKKIQDDSGVWQSIDGFLKAKTKMKFSHGICPDCAEKFKSSSHSTSS